MKKHAVKSADFSKDTLAKNLIRSASLDARHLRYLQKSILQVYDRNKELAMRYQDRMNKIGELFHEFNNDPNAFVEKYAQMDNNSHALEILRAHPNLFDTNSIFPSTDMSTSCADKDPSSRPSKEICGRSS